MDTRGLLHRQAILLLSLCSDSRVSEALAPEEVRRCSSDDHCHCSLLCCKEISRRFRLEQTSGSCETNGHITSRAQSAQLPREAVSC